MTIENICYIPASKFLLQEKMDELVRYLCLSAEYGCPTEGKNLFNEFQKNLNEILDQYQHLVLSQKDSDEPDDLPTIQKLRPSGVRKMTSNFPSDYRRRLEGAFYGRMAGCTLGAALEFEPVDKAKAWALRFGDNFPLTDYWSQVKDPEATHYIVGKKIDLTKGHMDAVPPDDDTIYTLLSLLLLEEYGFNFTQENMADIWKKYLPLERGEKAPGNRGCWWGERQMLQNLLDGMKLPEAGTFRNPNLQNIAAWTRADTYGYVCAGWPEKAAELAYRDASANHRRNGVYGSMFMAATIAAAFLVNDPIEAVKIGLTEIPKDCLFAQGIRWALEQQPKDYQQAYDLVWKRYNGMFNGSALTNALHVVMGLQIGNCDFTKTIGETVAMSGDNDCTGATAGSIIGAVIGINHIPSHWVDPFQDRMHIYLNDQPEYLEIQNVCDRIELLAKKLINL
ncbi:ADP-ribosyl-[dinitrogen reductase] hydrolase [uncultured Ruminococcus sp.]|uniref:ADP-ribosylglycohydrolase family protein n=1 Tax=Massiliimalia timonensis TaxID=1987501 RepID=A0A8J6TQX0_9FIRM|nr:ADP-ribosylglycohydrolase family protein [Massiliimalia timonensis]MBC8611619.1 ADP-ribosylglycohydrolase family protein [Massiliimalia timonensis]SCH56432.1 ADP-ribosyl-[dinitrogen reductase] hydrolase [uncultured Clostridium sp.]SCH68319.1 ADP-ribosyl-[dinitrogen reductase] hydrolase [uncultured Ruminococcus sp.]